MSIKNPLVLKTRAAMLLYIQLRYKDEEMHFKNNSEKLLLWMPFKAIGSYKITSKSYLIENQ
ncbi:MAG: hypothetical protein BGO76_00420 [Caedibacter sp. 38-128]|nr:MAG: hypothetical protein BGO76_00420 [Caedibacter sp. 38-128]